MLQQLSIFIENKKGNLTNVTRVLKDNQVDIRAIAVFDTPEFGILRIIVNKPDKAKEVLVNDGYIVHKSEVIAIELEDTTGRLNDILTTLGEANLSVNYIYSFVVRKESTPLIVCQLDDNEKAKQVLREANIKVIDKCEIQE